ncbi:MAG: hypothetical protein PGN19_14980 [Pseudomonas oryzihabitans]
MKLDPGLPAGPDHSQPAQNDVTQYLDYLSASQRSLGSRFFGLSIRHVSISWDNRHQRSFSAPIRFDQVPPWKGYRDTAWIRQGKAVMNAFDSHGVVIVPKGDGR